MSEHGGRSNETDVPFRTLVEALEHIVIMLERGESVPYWAITEARTVLDAATEHTRQYGVQVVWSDPVEAGATKPGEPYEPRWLEFSTEEQADAFASIYVTKLEAGPHNGVAAVNRAARWAAEQYGPWVAEVVSSPERRTS